MTSPCITIEADRKFKPPFATEPANHTPRNTLSGYRGGIGRIRLPECILIQQADALCEAIKNKHVALREQLAHGGGQEGQPVGFIDASSQCIRSRNYHPDREAYEGQLPIKVNCTRLKISRE